MAKAFFDDTERPKKSEGKKLATACLVAVGHFSQYCVHGEAQAIGSSAYIQTYTLATRREC